MKIPILITLTLLLSGCAGSRIEAFGWESRGALRVSEPDSNLYNYKIYLKALRDVGFDSSIKSDRLQIISSYLDTSCKNPEIIDEIFLPTGSALIGNYKTGIFVCKVKCDKQ
jgi:hypothetical protein